MRVTTSQVLELQALGFPVMEKAGQGRVFLVAMRELLDARIGIEVSLTISSPKKKRPKGKHYVPRGDLPKEERERRQREERRRMRGNRYRKSHSRELTEVQEAELERIYQEAHGPRAQALARLASARG